jgi:hypothetical protein
MKRYLASSWRALITGIAISILPSAAFAAPGDIKITEVMFNATYDDVWEWIEITNTGASAINMDGYYAFPLGQNDILDTANGGLGPSPSILSTLDPDTTVNPGETMILYDAFYASGNTNNFNTDTQFRSAWSMSPSTKVLGLQFWPTLGNTTGGDTQSIGFWNDRASWRADMTPPGGGTGAEVTGFANSQFYLDFKDYPVTATVNGNSSITWTGNGDNHDGAKWVQSATGVNGAVTSVVTAIGTGSDLANPGIVSNFATPAAGLYFTEIMFDPSNDSAAPIGEWVELYNNTGAAIDLTGYVLDDKNNVSAATSAAGNIAAGVIPAGGVAILYPENLITAAEFEATWGPGLNLIGVSNWTSTTMSLNNSVNATTDPANPFYQINDSVALWDSYADNQADLATYTPGVGSPVNYNSQATAIAKQAWGEAFNGFPGSAINASIHLADPSGDPAVGANWLTAGFEDAFGSFQSGLRHPGGDVGSPGSFVVIPDDGQAGDFDEDGDVDGRDFLIWQRGGSTPGGPLSASDLADWQANYGTQPPLTAVTAVPEPASLAMLALALVPVVCGRKR